MKENKRKIILDAALECFKSKGVQNTRIQDVAKKAQVDFPLVTYYFPNIDGLLEEAVGFALDSLKDFTLESLEAKKNKPIEAFKAYVEAPFRWAQTQRDLAALGMYFYYLAVVNQRFQKINSSIRQGGLERISMLLYRCFESKVIVPVGDISVEQKAELIQGLITGMTIFALSEQNTKSVDSTVRASTVAQCLAIAKA